MTSNPFDNQEFRKELSELLDEKLNPLSTKVDNHESTINRSKGAIAAIATAWSALIVLFEYLFHRR